VLSFKQFVNIIQQTSFSFGLVFWGGGSERSVDGKDF